MHRQGSGAALAVTVQLGEDHDVVSLAGEFDFAATAGLRAQIDALLAAGRRRILVDLDAVTFVDGAAIGALISASEQSRRVGGTLEVTEHRLCLRLLRVTDELQRLAIHQDATEAGIDGSVAPPTRARPTDRRDWSAAG